MITKALQTLFAFLCLYLSSPYMLSAQAVSDTLSLEEITVQATRFQTDLKYQPVSVVPFQSADLSLYAGRNIASIIEDRSSATIRNYGPGGLATLSMRGYSPGRTQVVWNNFVMNDPVNGVFDLSLLPASFVDQMELSAGNSSSAFGSFAAGGTLYLDSRSPSNRISLWQTLGSFGQNVQGTTAAWSSENSYADFSLQREASDNDFTYRLNDESAERTNNRVEGLHAMINAGHSRDRLSLNTTLWFYDVENQAPGSIHFPSETAFQEDQAIQWANQIEYVTGRSTLYTNILFNHTDINFYDEAVGTESETNMQTVTNELGWRLQARPDLFINQSAQISMNMVESTNFADNESQLNLAYRANSEWEVTPDFRLFGSLRYDYYEISGDAFSGSFGASYRLLGDALIARGQASRNFVAPTLNDMFWPEVGNPDLLAETNNRFEAGFFHLTEEAGTRFTAELTGFTGRQYDGIQWVMTDTGTFAPRNVDEIHSRGVEAAIGFSQQLAPQVRFRTDAGVDYTRATIEQSGSDASAEGSQLVFVPEWTYRVNSSLSWRGASLGADFNYTGERYTTENNELADPLGSVALLNLYSAVALPIGNHGFRVDLTGRINNVTDRHYQFVDGYPMPGRHYMLTFRMSWIQ